MTSTCKCEIWKTGCICGFFALEQASKLSGKPITYTGADDPCTLEDTRSKKLVQSTQGSSTTVKTLGATHQGGRTYSRVELPCESAAWKNYLADPTNLFWKTKVLEEFERHVTAYATAQGNP